MNRKAVKVHRGIDNEVLFRALDPNGSPVSVCQMSVYARLIDRQNRTQILERLCYSKEKTGVFVLPLTSGDLADVAPGLYSLALVIKDQSEGTAVENTSVFFTDYESNVALTIEVTDQAQRIPADSVVVSEGDWYENRHFSDTGFDSVFVSSAIAANRTSNHLNSIHSFSVRAEDFTGKLAVYGSLDMTPATDTAVGWFTIDAMNLDEDFIEFIEYSGVRMFTFTGNYMWIRFAYENTSDPQVGSIKEITVRF